MAAHLINNQNSGLVKLKNLTQGQVGVVVSQDPCYLTNHIGALFLRTRSGVQQIGDVVFSNNGERFINSTMVRVLQPGEQIEM